MKFFLMLHLISYLHHFLFQPPVRITSIDQKVIDGHVIPQKVLFTAAVKSGEEYATAAFTDNLKVKISFFEQQEGKRVKSKSYNKKSIY